MGSTVPKFAYGDLIVLKPGAEIEGVPRRILDDGKLWAVDEYMPESGLLSINRVLYPYPGAYCSCVHERDVVLVMRRSEYSGKHGALKRRGGRRSGLAVVGVVGYNKPAFIRGLPQ